MSSLRVQQIRGWSSSAGRLGRKSRIPFDKRFPVTEKHVNAWKKGGSVEIGYKVAQHKVQSTGYINPKNCRFRNIPEMIPEFIVPDLTGFQLKPYVSYKVSDVIQSEFTAKDLFDAIYAPKIVKDFKSGKQPPLTAQEETS